MRIRRLSCVWRDRVEIFTAVSVSSALLKRRETYFSQRANLNLLEVRAAEKEWGCREASAFFSYHDVRT